MWAPERAGREPEGTVSVHGILRPRFGMRAS
jgi:hypothetical protein